MFPYLRKAFIEFPGANDTLGRRQWARDEARRLLRTWQEARDEVERVFSRTEIFAKDPTPPPHYRGTFDEVAQQSVKPLEEPDWLVGNRWVHATSQMNAASIRRFGFDPRRFNVAQAGEGVYLFHADDLAAARGWDTKTGPKVPVIARYVGKKPIGQVDSALSFRLQNGAVDEQVEEALDSIYEANKYTNSQRRQLTTALVRQRYLQQVTREFGGAKGFHLSTAEVPYLVVYNPKHLQIMDSPPYKGELTARFRKPSDQAKGAS